MVRRKPTQNNRIVAELRASEAGAKRKTRGSRCRKARGELISKNDALLSLGYVLTGFRQQILLFPRPLERRLAGKEPHEIGEILRVELHALLNDLSEWPMRAVDPNWMAQIDDDLRPREGGEEREERRKAKWQA